MPELGKYAFAVLSSYGVTGAFLAVLVLATLWRGGQVKRALAEAEARVEKSNG